MPRYRLIVCTANEQLTSRFQRTNVSPELNSEPHLTHRREDLGFLRMLHCIRRFTPQLTITWKDNLRYMEAGEEAQQRHYWAKGTPGYQ
jgi:hypothetical protein